MPEQSNAAFLPEVIHFARVTSKLTKRYKGPECRSLQITLQI